MIPTTNSSTFLEIMATTVAVGEIMEGIMEGGMEEIMEDGMGGIMEVIMEDGMEGITSANVTLESQNRATMEKRLNVKGNYFISVDNDVGDNDVVENDVVDYKYNKMT